MRAQCAQWSTYTRLHPRVLRFGVEVDMLERLASGCTHGGLLTAVSLSLNLTATIKGVSGKLEELGSHPP